MLSKTLFSSDSVERETPKDLYQKLNKKWKFTLDPCATKENAKCQRFFTREENGLVQSWKGEVVFMNPPYGREISDWIAKACLVGALRGEATVVCLLPARTDTSWVHDFVLPFGEITFIRGRLKFGGSKNSAPFPSMIVEFSPRTYEILEPFRIIKPTPASFVPEVVATPSRYSEEFSDSSIPADPPLASEHRSRRK